MECASHEDCKMSLGIGPVFSLEAGSCDAVLVSLTVAKGDGRLRVHEAKLSAVGWEELLSIARTFHGAIDPRALAERGCTGCEAGSGGLLLAGEQVRYPLGRPPSELGGLDGYVQELIDTLLGCNGDRLEDACRVTQQPGLGSDEACEIVYSPEHGPSTSCKLAPAEAAPCRAAAECLCSGAALDRAPEVSVEECTDAMLSEQARFTFADVCVEGLVAAAPRSLSDALLLFADGTRASVSTSGLCAGLDARF